MFTLHILEEQRFHPHKEHETLETPQDESPPREPSVESYVSPYEVDIDIIAEHIVPRIIPKEPVGDYAERILNNLSKHFQIAQGIFYLKNVETEKFESLCTYAYNSEKGPSAFKIGEGIPGQVAKNKTILNLREIPENYLNIQSGLGDAPPRNILFLPLLLNKETIGIIEIATFHGIDGETEWTLKNLAKIIGNAIITKTKTGSKV